MGRLSQPTKPAVPKQQRTTLSILANARLPGLGNSPSKGKTRSRTSRFSLGAGLGLGASSKARHSPKIKPRSSRFSLPAFAPSSQQQQQQPAHRGRKTDSHLQPSRHKASPSMRKSTLSLGGGGFKLGAGSFGARAFGSGWMSDSEDGSSDSGSGTSGEGSSGSEESGSEDQEAELADDENSDARNQLVPNPAFEKQKLKELARGPLGSAAFEIVQEVERVLERTTEKSKALFVDGMGEVMGVELIQTVEAMEKRAEVGTAHLRQSKDQVVAELAANFTQIRASLTRMSALQDRILQSRKKLATQLEASREETTAKLDSLARNYQDTCAALRKGLRGGGRKR